MSEQRFLVTARKYRPQRFDEVVAQEHVTGTLRNAVRLDRLAHAYLFTGPRGVGKTTAARILAKAINCTAPPEERPDAEPCRRCDSCRSFEEGRNLNIIEIDAASNNKVDDIRELRETVRIPPQGNRRKVYIVDEVHMLTTQAFNALLKTLEEPPPHVLFIFATTEPHKVIATIQSRCQRFDFRRIPVQDIVERLRAICAEESIAADDGSLMLIARRGDGALRDALSVFDQAVSLCGDSLTQAELVEALGIVDEDLYFRVTGCITRGDTAGMLGVVDTVVRSGYDLQEFLDGLAEHLRNLLVARTMPDPALIEASEATRKRYAADSGALDETSLLRLLSIVDQAMDHVRASRQPRLRLELALLKMASLPSSVDLRAALAGLGPARDDRAAPSAPRPDEASGRTPPAASPAGPPSDRRRPKPTPLPAPPAPEQFDTERKPAAARTGSNRPATGPGEIDAPAEPGKSAEGGADQPATDPVEADAPPTPPGPTLFDAGAAPAPGASQTTGTLGRPALEVSVAPSTPRPQAAADVAVADDGSDGMEPAWWPAYIERVKDARIHVGALLHHAAASTTGDGTLRIEVPDDFHVRVLREEAGALDLALNAEGSRLATGVRVVRGTASPSGDEADETPDPEQRLRDLCEEYPALRLLMERFGGEIVW